jgi:hypothetical protein
MRATFPSPSPPQPNPSQPKPNPGGIIRLNSHPVSEHHRIPIASRLPTADSTPPAMRKRDGGRVHELKVRAAQCCLRASSPSHHQRPSIRQQKKVAGPYVVREWRTQKPKLLALFRKSIGRTDGLQFAGLLSLGRHQGWDSVGRKSEVGCQIKICCI